MHLITFIKEVMKYNEQGSKNTNFTYKNVGMACLCISQNEVQAPRFPHLCIHVALGRRYRYSLLNLSMFTQCNPSIQFHIGLLYFKKKTNRAFF